jgi:hypothetical protein
VDAALPLPARAVQVDPVGLGADSDAVCHCDDNLDYVIKDRRTHRLLPHSEWFCSHLADFLGIAGPPCKVVEMPDGSKVFGSRWEGGVLRGPPHPRWWELVIAGTLDIASCSATLTRLYVFDHFVHNVDRHLDNILARDQRSGIALLALDYSHAWLMNGFPLPALPLSSDANTVAAQRDLARQCGPYVNLSEARRFSEQIKRVPVGRIKQIISAHPKEWLSVRLKSSILKWWSSEDMISRVEGIATGIEDGTYL